MLVLAFETLQRLITLRERNRRNTHRLSELKVESDKYKELSNTDSLTGISNRAGLMHRVSSIMQNNQHQLMGYAVMVLDVDHFKKINDENGHDIGDNILKNLSHSIKDFIRSDDYIARWGGEEFVILAHLRAKGSERILAEKIRMMVESTTFENDQAINITVSLGVAIAQFDETFDDVFKRADKNLYKAKSNGRNRVVYDQIIDSS